MLPDPHDFKNLRILLADDSVAYRKILRLLLNRLGCTEIVEAPNGKIALSKIHEKPPDLLISDWYMPAVGGLDLVRRIRWEGYTFPVIMCTTESQRIRVREAARAGVTLYVVKPFTKETLIAKIKEALDRTPRPSLETP